MTCLAVDLIVRYCCKNRWATIAERISFTELDEDKNGSLSREEIRRAIQLVLGEEPSDGLVDEMLSTVDYDANGNVDENEYKMMLSKIRDQA